MKCAFCGGSGIIACRECFGEGECTSCQGEGREPCRPCGGTGDYDPDSFSKKAWAEVPEPIRKMVERHVVAHLPSEILAKLHELHPRGLPISHEDAFFHFGGGMAVRNLCRERLSDDELARHCFLGNWDDCYIGVLAAIAATRQ
jgi:hypothetical protein